MKERQTTDRILMVRPRSFGFNSETAKSNKFQSDSKDESDKEISEKALQEFDEVVNNIRRYDIEVVVFEDTTDKRNYDAVFPNNWISFHQGKYIITYPMQSVSRRQERREDIIEFMEKEKGYDKRYAFEYMEEDEQFLEGTGSMVLDRINRIVYASLSPRTDIRALDKFAVVMGYSKLIFHSEMDNVPIYHTNVMMSVADRYCIICPEVISDQSERESLLKRLRQSGKEIIELKEEQLYSFCANVLQLQSRLGEPYLIMSTTAYNNLELDQLDSVLRYNKIIQVDIPTIEKYGGGGVRCMIAEMH